MILPVTAILYVQKQYNKSKYKDLWRIYLRADSRHGWRAFVDLKILAVDKTTWIDVTVLHKANFDCTLVLLCVLYSWKVL